MAFGGSHGKRYGNFRDLVAVPFKEKRILVIAHPAVHQGNKFLQGRGAVMYQVSGRLSYGTEPGSKVVHFGNSGTLAYDVQGALFWDITMALVKSGI
jgi:hypothetical protein